MTKRIIGVIAVIVVVVGLAFWMRGVSSDVEQREAGAVAAKAVPSSPAQVVRPTAAAAARPAGQTPTSRGTLPFVLTSATPVNSAVRLAVEAQGARVVGVRSQTKLLIEASEAVRDRLRGDARFTAVTECLPQEKVQAALAEKIAAGATSVEASVLTLSPEDRQAVISRLTAGGGELLQGCINEGKVIRAKLPADLVAALAAQGEVRWMESFERPHLMNDMAVNPGAMNVRPVWKSETNLKGLSGAGQSISTSDSGIDTGNLESLHWDLTNAVQEIKVSDGCTTNDVNGHGTHTAGSIVGDGTRSNGRIRGTAWGAKLYAWSCGRGDNGVYTPETMAALFRADDAEGWADCCIHSASWGSDVAGRYTAECSEFDQYVWEHPEFLPVVAAGNAGPNSKTVGSPAAAKNVLAVGATQNLRSDEVGAGGFSNGSPELTASFSSRGSCQDGRIKPDIAAPGVGILSTRSHGIGYGYGIYNEFYAYDSGTSMACPLTAGAVALVREWLVTNAVQLGLSEEEPPTAALMKAVITGGASGRERPSNDQGWGRVDLEETLFPSNRAVKLVDRIPFADGAQFVYVVETTNAAPLDVQLVWVDYPGDPETAGGRKLVNDLDLTVEARWGWGDDRTWYGNGGTSPDRFNNLESVRIPAAKPTKYVITVSCPTVLYDDGGAAALYIRGAFDPTAEPAEPAYVRIRDRGLSFRSLPKALAEVQAGETVELLDWVVLPSNSVMKTSFTLTATNGVPAVSPILRKNDASLTITEGATVLFTNVVFEAGRSASVLVTAGAKAQVAGTAVFDGLVKGVDGIAVRDPSGFELVGRLDNGITVACEGASQLGNAFGTYRCDDSAAAESARRLVSSVDMSWAGVAVPVGANAGRLFWQRADAVDPAVAVAYVDGTAPIYYRALDQLLDEHPEASKIVITRSGYPLELPRTISGVRTISAAEGAGEIVVRPGASAGFTLAAGADLTVSGLTFCDYEGNALFVVRDGARLTVTNAVFRNITGTNTHSGAIAVFKGRVKSCGSVFEECHAGGRHLVRFPAGMQYVNGNSYGGAVYLNGADCELLLDGGAISNCWARNFGGAVFAGQGASVSVQGALKVVGNVINTKEKGVVREENVYLRDTAVLRLTGSLTGDRAVGVYHQPLATVPAVGNELTNRFATVASGVGETAAIASARAFVNDVDPDGLGAEPVRDGTALNLMWVIRPPDDHQVDPSEAAVAVTKGGETRYYADPAHAFGWADAAATVELLKDVTFDSDLVVSNGVSVLLRTGAGVSGRCVLKRADNCSLRVLAGGSLTVTNLQVNGGTDMTTVSLVQVNGGALELQAGASVREALGAAVRAAGAVTVWNRGTFVLRGGAEIADCVNDHVDAGSKAGYGGGLLVDNATAELCGGTIRACRANRGGGVFVGSGSTVLFSGDVEIDANYDLQNFSLGGARIKDNVCVADQSELVVAGKLTGSVGYNEGRSGDTNVFGTVAGSFAGTAAAKQASAHCFTHDDTGDVGMAVSDGSKTLLVWSQALDADGKYEGTYSLLDGAPYPVDPPTAVGGLTYDGLTKTGVVEGIGYALVGNTAVDAGAHVATATLRTGFSWSNGEASASTNVIWQIGKGYYDLSGVSLEKGIFAYDGNVHSLEISGQLPVDLTVCYSNNLHWAPGTNLVTAIIKLKTPSAASQNLVLKDDPTLLTNDLVIIDFEGKYAGGDQPVSPEPEYVEPGPIAFKSITRVSETEWVLVVTDRVQWAEYRLIWTRDLTQGFTSTGAWERATAGGAWTTNVVLEAPAPAVFWKAEAQKGRAPANE